MSKVICIINLRLNPTVLILNLKAMVELSPSAYASYNFNTNNTLEPSHILPARDSSFDKNVN